MSKGVTRIESSSPIGKPDPLPRIISLRDVRHISAN